MSTDFWDFMMFIGAEDEARCNAGFFIRKTTISYEKIYHSHIANVRIQHLDFGDNIVRRQVKHSFKVGINVPEHEVSSLMMKIVKAHRELDEEAGVLPDYNKVVEGL